MAKQVECLGCGAVIDVRGKRFHLKAQDHIDAMIALGEAGADAPEPMFEEIESDEELAPSELDALREQLAEAKRQAAEAEQAALDARRTTHVPILTAENIEEVFPQDELNDRVEELVASEIASANPLRPLPQTPEGWELMRQKAKKKIIEKILTVQKAKAASGADQIPTTSVKMVHPQNGKLCQVIAEPHVNSADGSPDAAIRYYLSKGFKIADPPRCLLYNCYEGAARQLGRFEFKGYCSLAHLQVKEGRVVKHDDQVLTALGG